VPSRCGRWENVSAPGEVVGRPAGNDAKVQQVGEIAVPGDFSEADHTRSAQGFDLAERWIPQLRISCGSAIAGRAHLTRKRSRHAEFEAVITEMARVWSRGPTMQNGVHEITGAVSGEGAAGTVGSMSSGSQTRKSGCGSHIPRRGQEEPIDLILVGRRRFRDPFCQ